MTSVIIRIGLRWLAGFLVAKGIFSPDDATLITTDPELVNLIEIALGMLIGTATELWYYLARKLGWST